jgi:hypothetical protein
MSNSICFHSGEEHPRRGCNLHETIHEIHSKQLNGVLFKIDIEKAYDKVKWCFLQEDLHMKGFDLSGVTG